MAISSGVARNIKVADEVWLAAALLHRERPDAMDFSVEEIVARVHRENIEGRMRPGVYVHAIQHSVANVPPTSGRYRMLFATARNRRRLYKTGDPYHPQREGSKMVPAKEDLPARYRPLVDWYESEFSRRDSALDDRIKNDPILALAGTGKHLFDGKDPDEYVRRLREGWD